jgi:hypothetical protein
MTLSGRSFTLVLGGLAALLAISLRNMASAKDEKLWQLNYDTGVAPAHLYLADNGVKIEYWKHLNLLSVAPKWQLSYYSKKVGKCFDLPLSHSMMATEAGSASYDFRKARPGGSENWCGAKADKMILPLTVFRFNGFSSLVTEDAVKAKEIDLYETASVPLAKNTLLGAQAFFCERYGVRSSKLPLGLKVIQADGTDLWLFKLRSIRQMPYKDDLFVKPKNLKAAKTMGEIVLDDQQRSAMSDMAEDMNLGEAFGTKQKK